MVSKVIIFCDRCGIEMKPRTKDASEIFKINQDLCPKCQKEYDIWMKMGKEMVKNE